MAFAWEHAFGGKTMHLARCDREDELEGARVAPIHPGRIALLGAA